MTFPNTSVDMIPIIEITAVFTHLAHFPFSTEQRGPAKRDKIMDRKGKFCTNSIISPPSSTGW